MSIFLIVPGRADTNGLTWWVRSTVPVLPEPITFHVCWSPEHKPPPADAESAPMSRSASSVIILDDEQVAVRQIARPTPMAGLSTNYGKTWLVSAIGLEPDHIYELVVEAGTITERAFSKTLPVRAAHSSFTVAFGSCYEISQDKNQSIKFFPPRRDLLNSTVDLRVSLGDQVYMDLDSKTGHVRRDPPNPIDRYQQQWQGAWMTYLQHAPNLTLVDDHEFWNNYPEPALQLSEIGSGIDSVIEFLDSIDGNDDWENFSGHWFNYLLQPKFDVSTFHDAVSIFQSALNVSAKEIFDSPNSLDYWTRELVEKRRWRSFSFNNSSPDLPVRLMGLDLRSFRTKTAASEQNLVRDIHLTEFENWLDALDRPGVLCVSQCLTDSASTSCLEGTFIDHSAADYAADYARIWDAIKNRARHSVLIVSGDIHWSRLRRFPIGSSEGPMNPLAPLHYELVTSPLSRIIYRSEVAKVKQGKVEWMNPQTSPGSPKIQEWYWQQLYGFNPKRTYATVEFQWQADQTVIAIIKHWVLYKDCVRPYYRIPPELGTLAQLEAFIKKSFEDPLSADVASHALVERIRLS